MKRTIYSTFRSLLNEMPEKSIRHFNFLLFISLVMALTELCSVSLIALFVASVTDINSVLQSPQMASLGNYLFFIGDISPSLFLTLSASAMVFSVIAKNLVQGVQKYFSIQVQGMTSFHFGQLILGGFMRMPYQWLMKTNSSSLMTHTQWAQGTGAYIASGFTFVSDLILITVLFIGTAAINPPLVCSTVLALGIVAYGIFVLLRKHIDILSRQRTRLQSDLNSTLFRCINGIKDIRIFGKESYFLSKNFDVLKQTPKIAAKLSIWNMLPGWTLEAFGFTLLAFGTLMMVFISGENTAKITGSLALMAVAAWRGLPAIIRILNSFSSLRSRLPSMEQVLDMIQEIEKLSGDKEHWTPQPAQQIQMHSHIQLKSICFKYDSESTNILEDVDFTIYKGQSVGIIGVSGAGKSTLMDLIIGLLPPTSGTLLLDGRELDEPSRTAWMRHVGYVSQQPYVLDATLAQNIAFGIPEDDIDPVRLRECCELSAVNEFLEVLAEGLETWLGENGSRLSGGQQQRVCIARALYPNPDLLIFDEATSSLDNKNEAFIRETIQGLKGKQTMIIVAHRLSTVELCDTVIWLENGKLHQIGAPSKIIPNYLKSQLHITKQIR